LLILLNSGTAAQAIPRFRIFLHISPWRGLSDCTRCLKHSVDLDAILQVGFTPMTHCIRWGFFLILSGSGT